MSEQTRDFVLDLIRAGGWPVAAVLITSIVCFTAHRIMDKR